MNIQTVHYAKNQCPHLRIPAISAVLPRRNMLDQGGMRADAISAYKKEILSARIPRKPHQQQGGIHSNEDHEKDSEHAPGAEYGAVTVPGPGVCYSHNKKHRPYILCKR